MLHATDVQVGCTIDSCDVTASQSGADTEVIAPRCERRVVSLGLRPLPVVVAASPSPWASMVPPHT